MRYFHRSKQFWLLLIPLFSASLLWCLLVGFRTPRNDRVWDPGVERLSSAAINGASVTISNVRDWTYAPQEIRSRDWLDAVTVDINELKRVWFLLEPFPGWKAVGHTYLTFEFSYGRNLSFSVEARKEADEEYSPIKGLFRGYELAYTWGTERDFLTRRLLYLDHAVRAYPLTVDSSVARSLFLSLAERTNNLRDHPAFYNTLTANCTNLLAEEVNRVYPRSIPYNLSWNFPGSSDVFLMKQGLIAAKESAAATMAAHDLSAHRSFIAAIAVSPPAEFSNQIRGLLND